MSFTHVIQKIWGAGSDQLAAEVSITDDVEQNVDTDLETGIHQFDIEFTEAKLKSIFIWCKDLACQLRTNNYNSPADTIQLSETSPFQWDADSGVPYPFAGAVTSVFIEVNDEDEPTSGGTACQIRVLLEP